MYEGGFFGSVTLGHIVVAAVVVLVGIVLYISAVRDLNRFRRKRGDREEGQPTAKFSLEDVLRDLKTVSRG